MTKTIKIFVILLWLFNIIPNKASAADNHLEPVRSIFDNYDYQFEYYTKVRKVLFEGLSGTHEIRFQVMPSFTPESVLEIEVDDETNKYYLVYHICEEKIWNNENWDKVKVIKYKTEIEKESVDLVKSLFEVTISQTRYPVEFNGGSDGETYYFSVFNFGIKSGRVWSPSKGTKMDKLVNIGNELIKLAKSKVKFVKIDRELREMIENLILELK